MHAALRMRIGTFMLALAAILLLPLPGADAARRSCAFHYTDADDLRRLQAAMQGVMPAGVSAEGSPDICRNQGAASASLRTPSRLNPDGVVEWWDVNCERRPREWACKAPEHHQLISVYAETGGVLRRLEVTFDDATGLERARTLAARAMQIIQDPAFKPVSPCDAHSRTADSQEWEKVRRH